MHRLTVALGLMAAFLFLTASRTNAQMTYADVHDFGGQVKNSNGSTGNDGVCGEGGIAIDAAGNRYGTTQNEGAYGGGMIWEVTTAGKYIDLHDFGSGVTNANGTYGLDGDYPNGHIFIDSLGNLYGTTASGGGNYNATKQTGGMVWEITSTGKYFDLHDFNGMVTNANGTTGPDGYSPFGAVSMDSSGNLYGTTAYGGPISTGDSRGDYGGNLWEINVYGTYLDLHDFGGLVGSTKDGYTPEANVVIDKAGDLFGTATYGGKNAFNDGQGDYSGVLWEIPSGGTYKIAHYFGGTIEYSNTTNGLDGVFPDCIAIDSTGNLYGTCDYGGMNLSGILWKYTPGGVYSDLHDFGGTVTLSDGTTGTDGYHPFYSGVTIDAAGDMFGTTFNGGKYDGTAASGIVWEYSANATYFDLHDFGGTVKNANGSTGPDGDSPYAGVAVDLSGNIYGATFYGGPNGMPSGVGMIFQMTNPEKVTNLALDPTTIGGLGSSNGTVTILNPAPPGGWVVGMHAGASGYLTMPATMTVPYGQTTGTFTITGTGQRASNVNMGVFAADNTSSAEAILTIQGDSMTSLALNPSQIKWQSGTAVGTVTLTTAAPPGGWVVNLSAGATGYLTVPTSVTVPSGATSTTFNITGNAQRFFTLTTSITAKDGPSTKSATLVVGGDAIKSLVLSPTTMGWSDTCTATLTLVAAAPPGGWLVNVHAGASGYVNLPSSVTVPAGQTSTTFTITGAGQRAATVAMGIYSNDGPSEGNATLTLVGDAITGLALNPSTIGWSGTSTGTITLSSAAPAGGWIINIKAGVSGYLTMPSTVTVPAGATTATFPITGTGQHSTNSTIGVFASDGNASKEALITLEGDSMKSLALNPTSVAPGSGSTGTITLNSPAPVGGWVVKLSVGAPGLVGVPASVTVPAGATTVTFPITTKSTDSSATVGVFANDGVSQLEQILTIT